MRFRYIDQYGREVAVEYSAELAELVKDGEISSDSLLFDERTGRWEPAGQHDVFLAVRGSESQPQIFEDDLEEDSEDQPELPESSGVDLGHGGATIPDQAWLFRQPGQIITVLAVVLLTALFYPGSGLGRLPQIIGATLGCLAIPSIVMIWSRRMRPYIPLAALMMAVLASVGWNADRLEQRAEARAGLDALHGLVDEFEAAGGALPDLSPPPATVPQTTEGRALWIADAVLRDMVNIADSIQRAFGVHAEPPGNWPDEDYLASATRHPDVRTYFERYLSYADAHEQEFEPLVDRRITQRLREAGITGTQAERWRVSFWDGYEGSADLRAGIAAAIRELSRASLDLHDLLVRNAGTVRLNPDGLAVSTNDTVNEEMDRLLDVIQNAATRLEEGQRRSVGVMRETLRTSDQTFR